MKLPSIIISSLILLTSCTGESEFRVSCENTVDFKEDYQELLKLLSEEEMGGFSKMMIQEVASKVGMSGIMALGAQASKLAEDLDNSGANSTLALMDGAMIGAMQSPLICGKKLSEIKETVAKVGEQEFKQSKAAENILRKEASAMKLSFLGRYLGMYEDIYGHYPTELNYLIAPPNGKDRPFLKNDDLLTDDWGAKVHYEVDADNKGYRLVSWGADGKKGGQGFDEDLVEMGERLSNEADNAVAPLSPDEESPKGESPKHAVGGKTTSIDKNTWRKSISTSAIDDSQTVVLSVKSRAPIPGKYGRFVRPGLILRCKENKTELFISYGMFIGTDETEVLTRIDKEEAKRRSWGLSTDHEATFFPGSPIRFIKSLFDKERLLVQVTPYGESPATVQFDIAGLSEVIKPLRESCNW